MLQTMISIASAILFVAALAYTPTPVHDSNPGCIVMPEVIEACVNSGGRFDYGTCSCVGGGVQ
ncbi:MAG TPA: hypothetical protein VF290_00665 [Pyrinomonadaceae bacterium]